MLHGIEAVTTATIGMALDAANLRHQAIASNIANAGTIGYRPLQVNFEQHLDELRTDLLQRGSADPFSLAGARLQIETVESDGHGLPPNVNLDMEAARLARNAVHYQTLIKGLNKHLAILSSAINDGRK